jgi:hypothetical protein
LYFDPLFLDACYAIFPVPNRKIAIQQGAWSIRGSRAELWGAEVVFEGKRGGIGDGLLIRAQKRDHDHEDRMVEQEGGEIGRETVER